MNASDILKYGQLTTLQSIEGLPPSAWETPGACGYWSIKDLIAHLASYENVLLDILSTFLGNDSTPTLNKYIEPGSQFNDTEVNQRKVYTVQDVLQEFSDTHAKSLSLVAHISPETLRQAGTLPWYGTDYALDDVIVYMYYGHKREHSAQIAVLRDRLKL